MADIFLSSTYTEMAAYRDAAFQAIQACHHRCVRMEDFPAEDREAAEVCRREVRKCEVTVLVLGRLYGSMAPGSAVSYTEREFNAAMENPAIECLVFAPAEGVATNLDPAQRRLLQEGYDLNVQYREQERFSRLACTGRVARFFTSPENLNSWIILSLNDYFNRRAQGGPTPVGASAVVTERKPVGRILPRLCDRMPHVTEFARSFNQSPRGSPETYILHGRDEDRHESCVERLLCLHIGRRRKTIAPDSDSRVVEWPISDSESVMSSRYPYSLFPLLSPEFDPPPQAGAADLCKVALGTGADYIVFRHRIKLRNWDAAAQKFFRNGYRRFWDSVAQSFAALAPGANPPRFLIFLEFKHGDGEGAAFRAEMSRSIRLKKSAGPISAFYLLPELTPVDDNALDTWFQNLGDRLLPPFRNQPWTQLFPVVPLPMRDVEKQLSIYLGLEGYGT